MELLCVASTVISIMELVGTLIGECEQLNPIYNTTLLPG